MSGEVLVGLRPERIRLSHRNDAADHVLSFPASVTLREDLGGEDIVYLDADGIALTMVDREHDRTIDLHDMVTVSISPNQLTLFDAATGECVGYGAHTAPYASGHLTPSPVAHHG